MMPVKAVTSSTSEGMTSLRERLVADNAYFKHMLGLLPPQLTQGNDEGEGTESDGEGAESDEREGAELEDPSEHSDSESGGERNRKRAVTAAARVTVDRTAALPPGAMEVDGASEAGEEDLQTKLQKKLALLKARRCKPGSAERLEQSRLKRRLSKAKLKQRRRKEKASAAGAPKPSSSGNPSNGQSKTAPKPIFNKEGKMVFSKFDFSGSAGERGGGGKKKKSDPLTGKNFKHLLEKVSKHAEKLEQLEKVDPSRALALQERTLWRAALSRAEGVKVKDDPALLRRAQKKKEKKNARSERVWAGRVRGVAERQQGVQDRRTRHLQERRDTKRDKARKLSSRKGRGHVAGF